jgi:hypothetical protein
VGGVGWAVIAIATETESGYCAVGVGVLAAFGVSFATRNLDFEYMQWAATLSALGGLAIGKFLIFRHFEVPIAVSMFDAIWALVALGAAWKLSGFLEADKRRRRRTQGPE